MSYHSFNYNYNLIYITTRHGCNQDFICSIYVTSLVLHTTYDLTVTLVFLTFALDYHLANPLLFAWPFLSKLSVDLERHIWLALLSALYSCIIIISPADYLTHLRIQSRCEYLC